MYRKKVKLSVIVPLFNERARVDNLYALFSFLKKKTYFYELIVVNDGSTDKTLDRLREIQKDISLISISYKKNKGKGHAIRKGVKKSTGSHVLFLDVDLSTSLSTFDEVVDILKKVDVVAGTRKGLPSHITSRQPLLRELLGRGFTALSRWITGVMVSDFTCGFKCFSQRSIRYVIARQKTDRWSFDTEFLFLAKRGGFSIQEIPVVWKNDSKTKVRFPQDLIISLWELSLIKLRSVWGGYSL